VLDGPCDGLHDEIGGVIDAGAVRAQAVEERPGRNDGGGQELALVGTLLALVVGACAPPPAEPPADPAYQVNFDSLAVSDVTFEIPDPNKPEGPPIVLTPSLPGDATGAWWSPPTGAFSTNLTFDGGIIDVVAGDLSIPIGYSAAQSGPAVGGFDPTTGQGGFSADVLLTVTSFDLGGGPEPMEQPCVLALGLDLEGAIDLDTGMLEVSQDGFSVTPPAEGD
jgi:hypothetical protein